jgi:hypothetical protein
VADREWTRPSAASNVGRLLFYRLRLTLGDGDLAEVLRRRRDRRRKLAQAADLERTVSEMCENVRAAVRLRYPGAEVRISVAKVIDGRLEIVVGAGCPPKVGPINVTVSTEDPPAAPPLLKN